MLKIIALSATLSLFSLTSVEAGGFKEGRAWQFEDPITKSLRLQKLYLQEMKKNGLGKSTYNTNYNSYTGSIDHADIGTYQSNINIQDQIVVTDSEYVNIHAQQNGSGDQTATNVSGSNNNVTP